MVTTHCIPPGKPGLGYTRFSRGGLIFDSVGAIRVGIIHMGFFYNGGGERTVLKQARGLVERGHEVAVFAPLVEEDCFPELMEETPVTPLSRINSTRIPLKTALAMVEASLRAPTALFRGLDVLVAHGQPSNWIAFKAWTRENIPYVSYLHQANRFLYPRRIDVETGWGFDKSLHILGLLHTRNPLLKKLDRESITHSRAIVTNSRWIERKVYHCYGKGSIVCYPGVDVDSFKPGVGGPKKYILTTNRHIPQKRIDWTIRCLKLVKERHPDTRCLITGEPTSYTRALREYCVKMGLEGSVEFVGNLPSSQLVKAYQEAYSYSYTSPEEDFGLGPLEAAACGVPSVVWDYAGPRETVVDQETGFRVKPYQVEEMARRHIELLEDPGLRRSMGERARRLVERRFTWERHCGRLERVLASAIGILGGCNPTNT